MNDDKLYLIHINECIADLTEYMAGGRDTFMNTKLIQDAVIRKLQIPPESTLRLTEALKTTHPEVNWRAIRGFRNVVVHDYMGIRLEEVVNIVEQDIPVLKNAVDAMLQNMEGNE